VLAQAVYGSIIGTITDQQGAAVAGAKVTVTSVSKGTTDEATTNESGNFSVTHLIPDTYNLKVEGTGFKAYEVKNVQVSADSSVKVDAKLEVGAVTQSIEVTGEVPQLKTDRADVAIEFNQKYVEDLPILNRNFTSFELLSPGTQKLVGWSHAATENPQGGQQIFVNGQHFSGTGFELDGTDNQDPILGIIVVNPNLDAISETKIALQDYDAETGKAVAGMVKVQTKSGSNDLHGSGFYYYHGSGQEARDPFTNAPGVALPDASWKQFGVTAGGPVIKDKLFFFADYQGTRQSAGITNQYTIPSAQVVNSCNPATNAASSTPGFCDLSQYLSFLGSDNGQIYDPLTGDPSTGAGRTPFANNQIPIGRISSQAVAVLSELPAPTSGELVNNFVGSGAGPFIQNSFDTRIDYAAPHQYQIFGRFSLDYFSLSGKGGLGALGGVGFGPGGLNGSSIVHNYSLAAGFNKPVGQKWLTDVRFGWFKYNPQTAYSDANDAPMDAFQIPGLNSGPGIVGPPTTGGLSSFFFDGNSDISAFGDGLGVGRCNCPLTESEQQFQFVNNWTRTQGNHTIKFGADIRYAMNLRVPSDSNRTGQLHFDAGDTSLAGSGGLSLATFLLGDVTSFERYVSTSLDAAERQKRLFFYGQDSWRITPKLTFLYGLRWEIYFPETVNGKGNGGFANIEEGVIRVAGFGNVGMNGNINNTWKGFAPRLSVAYQLDPKTVVRMGYGRSFDIGVFGSNFGHVVTQNLPVLAQQSLVDSNQNGHLNYTNGRSAVFNLATGPTAFDFSNIIDDISSNGTLPLLGPNGTVSSNTRPLVQRLPTVDNWNVTIQRQVTPTLSATVSYVGNKGTHVFSGSGNSYNANEAAIGSGTNPYSCSANTDDMGNPTGTFTCGPGGFDPSVSFNARRRFFLNGVPAFSYPGFTDPSGAPLTCCAVDLNYNGNDASSSYNALQIEVEKRFTQGLQFLAHYTYSHAWAYDSSYFSVDPKIAYGPYDANRNHVFVFNTVYELPFGRGKRFLSDASRAVDFVVGGWQVSNTTNWSGGLPFTASIGECGDISDAGPCRPDLLPGQSFSVGKRTAPCGSDSTVNCTYWFTPVAPLTTTITNAPNDSLNGVDTCTVARPTSGPFALPACGHIGNIGRNTFRGPHAFFSDLSLSKSFTFSEKYRAEFRFDAFNIFNHPVLGFNPNQGNACIDCSGDAGQISDIEADASPGSPNGMRQLQFGVRFTF
jgi:hypothetical protein